MTSRPLSQPCGDSLGGPTLLQFVTVPTTTVLRGEVVAATTHPSEAITLFSDC